MQRGKGRLQAGCMGLQRGWKGWKGRKGTEVGEGRGETWRGRPHRPCVDQPHPPRRRVDDATALDEEADLRAHHLRRVGQGVQQPQRALL